MLPLIKDTVQKYFPILQEEALLNEIDENGTIAYREAGERLIEIGAYIKQMPLLIKGTLKISREDKDGNELLLYYLKGGETCAMSLTCCMGDAKSNVRATAIDNVELIMLPTSLVDAWMQKYTSWKNFILLSYQARFEELLETVDSIAFMKMDERLEKYLTDRAKELKCSTISITHQDIALDLNTSREVVSRLLKQLEKLQRIKLFRNKIEILTLV